MSLRVLIIEREFAGHRLSGVRVLVDALLAMMAEHPKQQLIESITLATAAKSLTSLEFAEQLGPIAEHLKIYQLTDTDETVKPLQVAWSKWQDWRQLMSSGRFDHAYLPYGDGLLQVLSALRWLPGSRAPSQLNTEAIMMRGSFGYQQTARWTRWAALFALAGAPLDRIHLIDPVAYQFVRENHPDWLGKISLIPDPITPTPVLDRRQSRAALGLPAGGRLIGCVGRIDERKGCDLLVNSFLAASLGPEDRLLLAGIHADRLRAMIAQAQDPRIISIDRYLTEQELGQAIGAVDVMATPYPNFVGSASIVIRAAAGERICVASDDGWMGHVVPAYGLGVVCRVNDTAAFANALESGLEQAPHFQLSQLGRTFVMYGGLENVYGHWTALIRQRLGLAKAENLRPWPL